ncbi:MAG: hypothetical protein MK102_16865 [Fuerstiella sp.]|nr:hypothetical protein [Fuerstiella sp.]
MSQPDLTRPLAKLLSDSRLRHEFIRDPAGVAHRLAFSPATIASLQELDTRLLEQQARSLLGKRRFEVSRILPRTWHHLGDDAPDLFNEFALEAAWPTGHRRHLLDAAAFCIFLGDRADSIESARIRFTSADRRFALARVGGHGRRGFLMLLRWRNTVRSWLLFTGRSD